MAATNERSPQKTFPCLESKLVAMRAVDSRRAAGSVAVPGFDRVGIVFRNNEQPSVLAHPSIFVPEFRRSSFISDCAARITCNDSPDPRWFGLWMDSVDGEVAYHVRLVDGSLESFDAAVRRIVSFFEDHGREVVDLAIRNARKAKSPFDDDNDDDEIDGLFNPKNLLKMLGGR